MGWDVGQAARRQIEGMTCAMNSQRVRDMQQSFAPTGWRT